MKTASLDLVKKINTSVILETIRTQQPISRAAIAKKLSLSRSTVSSIVDQLLEKKFVYEVGMGSSTPEGGRRGVELGFNPKSSFGIGVDVGGTKTLVCITDLDGQVEYQERYKTPASIGEIIGLIEQSIDQSNIPQNKIIAMGVGFPGTVNIHDGIIIDSPSLRLNNYPVGHQLRNHFSFPVFVNNDVNCAALGEQWLGNGRNKDNLVFISIGTGIGSAIILNNQLIHGSTYSAGELGYFSSVEDVKNFKRNIQGQYGLLENKISGTALSQYGLSPQELLMGYPHSKQRDNDIVKDFILELAVTISNVVSLLNPEQIIIGGGVSESLTFIIEEVRNKVGELTPIKTTIELASLGNEAGALGAIAFAFDNVQEQQY